MRRCTRNKLFCPTIVAERYGSFPYFLDIVFFSSRWSYTTLQLLVHETQLFSAMFLKLAAVVTLLLVYVLTLIILDFTVFWSHQCTHWTCYYLLWWFVVFTNINTLTSQTLRNSGVSQFPHKLSFIYHYIPVTYHSTHW